MANVCKEVSPCIFFLPAAKLDPDGLSNFVSLSVFHAMPVSRVTTCTGALLSGLYTISNVSETRKIFRKQAVIY